MPRLNGSRRTRAPAASAASAVRSTEPSETTTTSMPGSNACSSATTRPIARSSLYAGTIAMRRSGDTGLLAQADEVEQPARPVAVGVLVEHALARPPPQLICAGRLLEQLTIRGDRFLGARDDHHFRTRLEPALDPLVRVRDDGGARGGELEQPARGRRVDGCVRAARDAQVEARGGDCARDRARRHLAPEARVAGVAAEVAAAEREVHVR